MRYAQLATNDLDACVGILEQHQHSPARKSIA